MYESNSIIVYTSITDVYAWGTSPLVKTGLGQMHAVADGLQVILYRNDLAIRITHMVRHTNSYTLLDAKGIRYDCRGSDYLETRS